MVVFLDPHGDDVPLFAAFSTFHHLKYLPLVVFDSHIQPQRGYPNCGMLIRREEAKRAYFELGADHIGFCELRDDIDYVADNCVAGIDQAIIRQLHNYSHIDNSPITDIYAPLWEHNGHAQHNLVANAALTISPGARVHRYTTYTRTAGRSKSGNVVEPKPEWIAAKHRALACFKSQMQTCTGCQSWFMEPMEEYLA